MEFTAWCKQLGIKHRKITPLWPAANAQVERFNKTLEMIIRIALVEGRNWRSELFAFLMNYQNPPHSSTGVSPASLMMNRHIRTKIPSLDLSRPSKLLQIARSNDTLRKSKAKSYMDKRHKATSSDIRQGDQVLLLQKRQNKLTTRYDPRPFTVVKKGSQRGTCERKDTVVEKCIHDQKNDSHNNEHRTRQKTYPRRSVPSHANITLENIEHLGRQTLPRTPCSQLS